MNSYAARWVVVFFSLFSHSYWHNGTNVFVRLLRWQSRLCRLGLSASVRLAKLIIPLNIALMTNGTMRGSAKKYYIQMNAILMYITIHHIYHIAGMKWKKMPHRKPTSNTKIENTNRKLIMIGIPARKLATLPWHTLAFDFFPFFHFIIHW